MLFRSVHLQNDSTVSATIENHPKGQGLLFDHADGTPIWLVLGNGDLVLDPGNKNTSASVSNQLTRQKDAFTRARFTQGQRFEDRSGSKNTAYFVSTQSRIPSTIGTSPTTSEATDPDPPFFGALKMWLPVSGLSGYSDGATVSHVPDFSGNKYGVYPIGTWAYQAQSANFNSRPSLKITSSDAALVNIDTLDGESEKFSHALGTNGFTAFFMIYNPTASSSGPFDLLGSNSGLPKTFFGQAADSNDFSLTNNGTTTTLSTTTADLTNAGLLILEFNHTTNNAIIYQNNAAHGTFVGSVVQDYRFDGQLFCLFGRALSANISTKTGTASNKAPQNVEFAEFIFYERVLTSAERQQVQGYLLNKYGVI